jgi:hypothetical protein
MSEPRRWLERNDLEAGDAVTQLLQSQRGFLPLDAAAAARVKHAVLHTTGDVPGQVLAQQGVLGRVGAQLARLGQHRFSASAVAATTVGAAALGAAALGGLLVLFGNPFAARSAPASDIPSAVVQAVNEPTARPGTVGSLAKHATVTDAVPNVSVLNVSVQNVSALKVRSARDPWAASLWNRAEGGGEGVEGDLRGVNGDLHCESASSFWGAFAGTLAAPRFGNMYCTSALASVAPDGFALYAAQPAGAAGADARLSANGMSLDAAALNSASLNAASLNAVSGGALERSQQSLGHPATSRPRTSGRPSGRRGDLASRSSPQRSRAQS